MDTASMDTTTRSGFGPVEIHSARGLDPALREILEVWFKEEFGQTIYQWSPADWYAVVKADGDPVGRLGILARTIAVGGDAVQVGGIAGVATRPEWRHRGVASVLMRAAAQFIQQDLKCPFGLLLCRRAVSPVYANLGWRPVVGPTSFEQPRGVTTYRSLTMVMQFGERQWRDGAIDLRGLPW
ncbi:MAG TPA: GNAT family N-acetyltransferase [Candidatus Binataceae bacterium]